MYCFANSWFEAWLCQRLSFWHPKQKYPAPPTSTECIGPHCHSRPFNRLSEPSVISPLASYITAYNLQTRNCGLQICQLHCPHKAFLTFQPIHTFLPARIIGTTSFVYSEYTRCFWLPCLWSSHLESPPDSLRFSETFPQFCSHLKTHLIHEISPIADCPRIWFTLICDFVRVINNI